jgi:hypothetical protein
LFANTTGGDNTAVGGHALYLTTTGGNNAALGSQALYNNTSGAGNTALGFQSMKYNIHGGFSTAVGYQALTSDTASGNTAVGSGALQNNSSGTGNAALGNVALSTNTTGINNTALGSNADVTSAALSNATAIGYNANVDSSNKVLIGNTSVVSIGGQVHWTTFSDERVKTNITPNVPGLSFLKLLQPVTYHYDINKENELLGVKDKGAEWPGKHDIEKMAFSGFIAQQVDVAAKSAGYDFSGVDKHGSIWGLRYSEFVPSIVKSVQELDNRGLEQQKMIEEQQKIISDQQTINLKQQEQMDELKREIEELKKK